MKRRLLLGSFVIIIAIQFVPVDRSNPPVTGSIEAPPEISAIFERSCYDCHSNQTKWPWYSRIAPGSWLVAHDVEEGREHLNFSEWTSYSLDEHGKLRREAWEEVEEGEMPLWFYTPLHPEARLSAPDKELIRIWSEQADIGEPMLLEQEQTERGLGVPAS